MDLIVGFNLDLTWSDLPFGKGLLGRTGWFWWRRSWGNDNEKWDKSAGNRFRSEAVGFGLAWMVNTKEKIGMGTY